MSHNPAQTAAVCSHQSPTWVQTVSGVTVLTIGLQGAAASAVSAPVEPFSEPVKELTNEISADATADISPTEAVEPATAQPRFSQFSQLRTQMQGVLPSQPSAADQIVARLEDRQRELHRHANTVESQLLTLQDLLSMQSYGSSFADRLIEQDSTYQRKLQDMRALEADIHAALEQNDTSSLDQLNQRSQFLDQELRQMAQQMLTNHMEQAQRPSTSGLWQEPIYRESLRWLMDYTHARHLVQAKQQTLARTLVATVAD